MILIYILFITINKKQKIIYNNGYIKLLLFSLGIIFYYSSNFFITYMDYWKCSLNFLFKNIGISLISVIYYINIVMGMKLGIKIENEKKFTFSDDIKSINYENINSNENIYSNTITNSVNLNKSFIENIQNDIRKDSVWSSEISEKLTKKIKNVHSLFIKTLLLYIFFILLIVILIINQFYKQKSNNNNNIIIQSSNGNWFYKCELENYDLILNSLYLIFLIIILIIGKCVMKYDYIFKSIHYIIYSLYILISIGPIINVNNIKFNIYRFIFIKKIFIKFIFYFFFLSYKINIK